MAKFFLLLSGAAPLGSGNCRKYCFRRNCSGIMMELRLFKVEASTYFSTIYRATKRIQKVRLCQILSTNIFLKDLTKTANQQKLLFLKLLMFLLEHSNKKCAYLFSLSGSFYESLTVVGDPFSMKSQWNANYFLL